MNKLQKKSTEQLVYIVTFDSVLPAGVTITSLDAITVSPAGLEYSDETVLAADTDGVPAGRGISIKLSSGSDGYEYFIMLAVTGSNGSEYVVRATLVVSDSAMSDATLYYGSVWEGDDYFRNILDSDAWDDASNPNKRVALWQATRSIDRLNFRGTKVGTLQFPRGTDTETPETIKQATFEIAIRLLDGVNVELEHEDLRTNKDKYGNVESARDTSWGMEHLQAGIVSLQAWHLLKPYLRDGRRIQLQRKT
jgi:hypothetical protein